MPEDLIDLKSDRARWPELRSAISDLFVQKKRDEWSAIFDGTDACVSPVLTMDEALEHSHLVDRGAFVEIDGLSQPSPVPRFSRYKLSISQPAGKPDAHTKEEVLRWWSGLNS